MQRRRLLFQDIRPWQVSTMWAGTVLMVVVAVAGSAGVADWARPGDFVQICSDSVPPMPPPTAGLGPRVAALDSMIACTERMEARYIARGDLASNASLALYALAAISFSFSAVATWRFFGGTTID